MKEYLHITYVHPPTDFKYLVLQITAISYNGVGITPLQQRTCTYSVEVHSFQIFHPCLAKFTDSDTEPVSTWSDAYNYKIVCLWWNTTMNDHTLTVSVASLLFYGPRFLPRNTSDRVENWARKEHTWKVNPHGLKAVKQRVGQCAAAQTHGRSRGQFPFTLPEFLLSFQPLKIKSSRWKTVFLVIYLSKPLT